MQAKVNKKCSYDGIPTTPTKTDPNLGEYYLTKNSGTTEQLLIKQQYVSSSGQAVAVLNVLDNRRRIVHQNLMALQEYSCKEESGFCSTMYQIRSYYEWYDVNLVRFRELARDPVYDFSEVILTKFLYDMVALGLRAR